MDGCVSVGGVKIDDSVSYCAAACWAGVIEDEVQSPVNSLSLYSNGGHSKGSAKIVMLHGKRPVPDGKLRIVSVGGRERRLLAQQADDPVVKMRC
jgi:hypothetical protein